MRQMTLPISLIRGLLPTMMADPEIATLTATNTFDFESLRREKTALFLVVPQNRINYYSGLMSLFYTDLTHFLLDDEVFARHGKSALPVYLLLDEFGHMVLPNFPAIITTTRQRRVSISIILQSVSQLEERYGRDGAQTILDGGIGSRLFFSGMDIDTAGMLSRTIGEIRTDFFDAFGRPHSNREPVMSPASIRAMPDDRVLYLFANKRPTLLSVTPYFRRGDLSKRTEQSPKVVRNLSSPVPGSVPYVPL
jgi:type IV secretion system protein VirD4